MKTSTLLMMAAAALPVWGQTAVPSAVPMPDTAMLLTLPAVVDMTAEQRAAALSAAALLPADTDSFIAFANLGKLATQSGLTADPQMAMLSGVDGLAIGISAQGAQLLQELLPLLQKASSAESTLAIANNWKLHTDEPVSGVIEAQSAEQMKQSEEALKSALQKLQVAPVYLAMTVKQEAVGLMQMLVGIGMGQMMQESPDNVVSHNGMQGIKLPVNIPAPEGEKELAAYLMYKLDGTKLTAILCADPAQAVVPASPAESVLAKADLQNARINDKTLVVASLSPALEKANNDSSMASIEQMGAFVSGVFRQLAAQSPAFGRPGVAAADGVEFLLSQIKEFFPASDTPSQLYVWMDEDVHLEAVQDAHGSSFGPALMKQPALLTDPDVAFCMEFAPVQGGPEVNVEGTLGALEAVTTGYVKTLREAEQSEATQALDRCLSYKVDVEAADAAIRTMSGALTGSSTLVVAAPAASQEVNIAAYSPVRDRAALTDGWNRLVKVAEDVRAKSECNKKCELPAVSSSEVAGGTAYTLQMPAQCPCSGLMTPGALVSDSALVVGTSAEYNSRLAASATGTMPLPGCVVQLRFEPTARIFERVSATVRACGEEERAAELAEIAEALRAADTYVERVIGASVIADDRLYTRLDVILRK
ncbi:MAG: hypothetical protein IJE66_05355 [Akkermansia sp.]|nr:hypothetical protein [Akkermansia sp.]